MFKQPGATLAFSVRARGQGAKGIALHSRLNEVLARAHAAITGAALEPLPAQLAQPDAVIPPPLRRPVEPPAPRVLVAPPPAPEVVGARTLTAGALALWQFVHDRARERVASQGLAVLPSHVVYHLPVVIVAAALGYCERHVYRLTDELRAAGLIDARGHVATVGKLRRYSGTLWAVAMKPGAPSPRLRWWDFQHDWRPGFAEEYHSEKGAFRDVQAAMSEPVSCEGNQLRILELAKTWAAVPGTVKKPAEGGSDMRPGRALQAIAHDLPGLIYLHPRQRHREVSRLAAELGPRSG